jgi:hypothetical protein
VKGRAGAFRTVHFDVATVLLDDCKHSSQTQAAPHRTGNGIGATMMWFEDVREVGCRNE